MSEIGNKIREVFRESAVYKNPDNNEVFVGRNLPSFVKDYLIATHIDMNGSLRREALVRFLDEHIPINPQAIRSRLMQGDVITLLIYQNYFCIYNYFIFKTLTILQT